MPGPITTYPTSLTNANWQSKKGKIAKIAGKTGIGELMTKCESEYKKVSWSNDFNAMANIDWRVVDPAVSKQEFVDQIEKKMTNIYVAKVKPLRDQLILLRDAAKKLAEKWKNNPLIPSDSRKLAEEVQKEADYFYMAMKENSDEVKKLFGYDKVRESLEKRKQDTLKVVNVQISDCEKGLKAALANPTKKGWESDGAHQGCRSVCNGITAVAEWKKEFYPTWQKFGDFYHKDIPDNDPNEAKLIKLKIQTVANELIKYKAAVHKTLNG